MTDIEQKALAMVNEVQGFDCGVSIYHVHNAKLLRQALCRAIEQHEAFRREVSDAVEAYLNHSRPYPDTSLRRFIIPKPDPLVEVINDADDMVRKPDAPSYAEAIRAALAARGLEIREKQP